MSMKPVKAGVIGCGKICGAYLGIGKKFPMLEIAACADLDPARAAAAAAEHGIPRACSPEELLADPKIQLVINLTIPKAHHAVSKAALLAGKHVYTEKPITVNRQEARELFELAAARKLLIGNAPDTFLGAGGQTCRKLIDDGWIGEPVGATAFMLCRGHESWHPDPEFYYQAGGGPMLDMGPYYLTALVNLLGPVRRVTGCARITFPERTITSEKKRGQKIPVEVPTHVAGTMEFASGPIGTILTSFDVCAHQLPFIEVYGTRGTLSVPNPNSFGGPVRYRGISGEWQELPLLFNYPENTRGIGAVDQAYAMVSGRPQRASGEMAAHVLDIMLAFHEAAADGRHVQLKTSCARPAPLPVGLPPGVLDE